MAGGYINPNPKVVNLNNLSKEVAFTGIENARVVEKQKYPGIPKIGYKGSFGRG